MPLADRDRLRTATDDNSLYAELWEYALGVMALDHFFAEVIEGNVPLDANAQWWERKIVPERVNRYSQPWCLVFEGVARLRGRIESQISHSQVTFDHNLVGTSHERRDGKRELKWTDEED